MLTRRQVLCVLPCNCDREQLGPCITEFEPLLSLALHRVHVLQSTDFSVPSDLRCFRLGRSKFKSKTWRHHHVLEFANARRLLHMTFCEVVCDMFVNERPLAGMRAQYLMVGFRRRRSPESELKHQLPSILDCVKAT